MYLCHAFQEAKNVSPTGILAGPRTASSRRSTGGDERKVCEASIVVSPLYQLIPSLVSSSRVCLQPFVKHASFSEIAQVMDDDTDLMHNTQKVSPTAAAHNSKVRGVSSLSLSSLPTIFPVCAGCLKSRLHVAVVWNQCLLSSSFRDWSLHAKSLPRKFSFVRIVLVLCMLHVSSV